MLITFPGKHALDHPNNYKLRFNTRGRCAGNAGEEGESLVHRFVHPNRAKRFVKRTSGETGKSVTKLEKVNESNEE